MPSLRLLAPMLLVMCSSASAQMGLKAEALKAAPPDTLAAAVKKELPEAGVRVLTSDGKPFADIWLRKSIPATAKPAGAKGTVLFPVLAEGELLGVVKFAAEGHDYRDQSIPTGVYTIRYGLQPVNGDHLGVSPFRDYALLVPAAKDSDPAPLAKKKLETQSAETVGSSHPAVLMLVEVPAGTKAEPKVVRDDAKNTSGVVLGLPLAVPNQSASESLIVQLILVGAAM
jgi:hypothetical protein